jgi:NAD-dependent DNA ligase
MGKGVNADIFNESFKPPEVDKKTNRWAVEQDIWQVGQLMAITLQGAEGFVIDPHDVRYLDCSPWLKEVIFRAIGPVATRFHSATAMNDALAARATTVDGLPKAQRVGSLEGQRLVFTGRIPGLHIAEAKRLALRQGATIGNEVTTMTDYLVVGETTALFSAGTAGLKIITASALNEEGANIRRLTPRQFMTLI